MPVQSRQRNKHGKITKREQEKEFRGGGKKNPGEAKCFRIGPDRLWGPPSLLCYGYRVSFLGVKRPGCGIELPLGTFVAFSRATFTFLTVNC